MILCRFGHKKQKRSVEQLFVTCLGQANEQIFCGGKSFKPTQNPNAPHKLLAVPLNLTQEHPWFTQHKPLGVEISTCYDGNSTIETDTQM